MRIKHVKTDLNKGTTVTKNNIALAKGINSSNNFLVKFGLHRQFDYNILVSQTIQTGKEHRAEN